MVDTRDLMAMKNRKLLRIDCRKHRVARKIIRSIPSNCSNIRTLQVIRPHTLQFQSSGEISDAQDPMKPLLVASLLDPLLLALKNENIDLGTSVETIQIDQLLVVDMIPLCEWIGRNFPRLNTLQLSLKHLLGGIIVEPIQKDFFKSHIQKCLDAFRPLTALKTLKINWARSLPANVLESLIAKWSVDIIDLTVLSNNLEWLEFDLMGVESITFDQGAMEAFYKPAKLLRLKISKLVALDTDRLVKFLNSPMASVELQVDCIHINAFRVMGCFVLRDWRSCGNAKGSSIRFNVAAEDFDSYIDQPLKLVKELFKDSQGPWQRLELNVKLFRGNNSSVNNNFALSTAQHSQLESFISEAVGMQYFTLSVKFYGTRQLCAQPYFDSKKLLAGNPGWHIVKESLGKGGKAHLLEAVIY